VATTDAAGFIGYGAGPSVRLIDRWGLGDPLIARLPAEVPWQIGHFTRRIPVGYELTLISRENAIHDPGIAAFYEKLRIITEGAVWSEARFETILAMNLGRYDYLISSYGLIRTPIETLDHPVVDGADWNSPPAYLLTLRGILLSSDFRRVGGNVEITVSGNDDYRLQFRLNGKTVGERTIHQTVMSGGNLRTSRIEAPETDWNAIAITPSGGDSLYSLAHVRVTNDLTPLQKLHVSNR
jgi:hypothetical protein